MQDVTVVEASWLEYEVGILVLPGWRSRLLDMEDVSCFLTVYDGWTPERGVDSSTRGL